MWKVIWSHNWSRGSLLGRLLGAALPAGLFLGACLAAHAADAGCAPDAAGATDTARATGAADRPPNVVLILGDDQAWTDFGFMGHPTIRTPHLDRLAAEGVVFTRGYVPASLCRPSLATIITGLYPHQHGITSNDPPLGLARAEMLAQRERQIARIEAVPTLPRRLAERGYASFQSGKWWEGAFARGGFTAGMTHGDPRRGGRHGDEGLRIGREGIGPIVEFLDSAGRRPFFLWYAPMLPHQPHNPPERLLEKYRSKTDSLHVARYWAMCEWFDETCGALLDELERRKLKDDTLIIFLVDNGWIQQPDAPGYATRSKRSQYDGGVRTPIVLRWPRRVRPRRDEQSLASSIDVVPTVLAACGVRPGRDLPGIDLLEPEAAARREAIFGEIFTHNAIDIDTPASSLMYRWMIDGWWKLIVPCAANVPDGRPELFDLKADPGEQRDRFGAEPERAAALRAKLDAWWLGR